MLLSPQAVLASVSQREVTLRIDDLLILIISFGWLARNAVYKEIGVFRKTPLNKAIVFYVTACFASTSFGMLFGKVHLLSGIFFVTKYIEYFLIFFIGVHSIHDREQINRYVIALLITAALVSIYGIFQIPSGERISAPFESKWGEPNTLGGYLVFIISILSGIFLSIKSRTVKIACLALIALAVIPLLFTLSRSAWMAVTIMYLSLILFSKRVVFLIVVLVIVVSLAEMIMPQKVEQRFAETFMKIPIESPQQVKIGGRYFDMSASARIIAYRQVLEDIKRHLFFGYGITGYGFIDGQYFRTLIETGLVGLAALLYLVCRVFIVAWRVYRDTADELIRGVSLGMLVGLAALLGHALSANTFIIVRIMEPFWLVMAMIVASEAIIGKGDTALEPSNV